MIERRLLPSPWVLGLTLITLAIAALGCGPSTALRSPNDRYQLKEDQESVEVELDPDITWVSVAIDNTNVYVLGQPYDTSSTSSERFMIAADRQSGKLKWQSEFVLPNNLYSYWSDLRDAGEVMLYFSDYVILGLSKKDGSVLWSIDTQATPLRVVGFDQHHLWGISYPNTIASYTIKDGKPDETLELTGYSSITDGWLTLDGETMVCTADRSGEMGVASINLDTGSVQDIFTTPYGYYDEEVYTVGPAIYSPSGTQVYARADTVAKLSKSGESLTVEMWDPKTGEQLWNEVKDIGYQDYYSGAYYARRYFMTPSLGLYQDPLAEGVLLNKVLRLRAASTMNNDSLWANVIPTQHYVDGVLEENGTVLIHTRSDTGDMTDTWFAFNASNGQLVWTSKNREFMGQTRDFDSDGKALVRLMTTDWIDGRVLIDVL